MQAVPEPDLRRALRDRREQRDRLVARLREQRVADPDRVEAGLLDDLRQVEQHRHVVVGRDQRLAVVQVDAELEHGHRDSSAANSSSLRPLRLRCGTRMCSDIRCAARSASPRLAARRIARVLGDRALEVPAQRQRAEPVPAQLGEQLAVELAQLARCPPPRRAGGGTPRSPRRTRRRRRARRARPSSSISRSQLGDVRRRRGVGRRAGRPSSRAPRAPGRARGTPPSRASGRRRRAAAAP